MQIRIRRLQAEYDRVTTALAHSPSICLVAVEGEPPEKYTFEYHVTALTLDDMKRPIRSHVHRAEVFLPMDYPRRPPFCRMITPVFHPNIDPQKICIGDHWSAGQTLDQLVVRIAEMLCYQSYNVKSPLNAEAAAWAERNVDMLPLEQCDLRQGSD